MHFYSLVALSTSCYRSKVTKRDCLNGKLDGTTILYEPSEEADEFIGTCLMLGIPITFTKIDTSIEISEFARVYILSTAEPMVVTTLTGRLITLYPSTSYLSSDECAL
ncbi:hypothetical protein psb1_0032 [Shigella phage pSb-1]|uniref:Uncharacterized protein n=1 Tax=Shigella phage pSb-1 TaxID=1414738 RepID=V5UPZ4_9CAUD|nr:hypothetical protein psb1_0032 [Shigella phage pSb-1]AHB79450.1 hypothetical protein psb1_0032 [Shigella phage pSb-1]